MSKTSNSKLDNSQSQAKPRIIPNSKFKTHNSGDMSPDNLVFLVNSRVKIHKWGYFVKNWPFFVKFIQLT